ncbi:telomere-associated protein Tap [Streptomyces solicathayae]|uniref:Helix-turn-helix domain-containing protein n=1 Tax=Streptomyces solicathayae TaxID=3081768 RepID=A0ABZ0M3L7_9ACTN|nr:helix-turn-helix domain-containing protein [Streptomyces sp. HUAS YS2]WOX26366.1 helix-turn-helix domain-containing protein [Streptomyces sp. HUAS YS2]
MRDRCRVVVEVNRVSTENELFGAVDALLEQVAQDDLPTPEERRRLREASGLSQEQIAKALKTRRETIGNWESGETEPRPPKRAAYARLLEGLAERFPPPGADLPVVEVESTAAPDAFTGPTPPTDARSLSASPLRDAAARTELENPQSTPAPTAPAEQAVPSPADTPRSTSASRRTAAPAGTAVSDGTEERFVNGPLLVVDADTTGQVVAYGVGGLVLDVPATSLASLVEWALTEARLGAPRLNGSGSDADPLLVLTAAACERYGLPAALSKEEQLAGRLTDGHKAVKQLAAQDWRLTKRGLGPWARIYRPAQAGTRRCVQLCLPSWNALDTRHWADAAGLPPAELAHLLGVYAMRVTTPRGSTAVTGLELMTALHPPTRASEPDATGKRHSEHNPGSLGKDPVDCAPCEAPDGHPLLADLPRFHRRTPAEVLLEEAYDWARELTDAECLRRNLVGIDVNMAFAAGANGLIVGLGAPTHVDNPVFDPKLPGSWLVDLSHIDLSRVKSGKNWVDLDASLLPSPFTPTGHRPEGPAWYATPTVAYAQELGYDVAPLEAHIRYDNGRYLDGWYNRLRDAYIATMADLGVSADASPEKFLAAMDGYRRRDPQLAIVVSAIKATVKGGIGKLRERPRGEGWKPGEPWRSLARPTWRPDIRAAVISRTRVNMHRKIVKHAAFTGQYPIAILSDCAVYAVDGTSPLDFLPYREGKPLPGGWRLGVSPGMVKHEGTQSVLWGEGLRDRFDAPELNLARYIKDGTVTDQDNGE